MNKVKRLFEMSELEKSIMMMVWSDVEKLPAYDSWRKYERSFTYEGKRYRYKCKYRVEDGHLRLLEPCIEHEQIIVDLMH
jgi:hypothetical protein